MEKIRVGFVGLGHNGLAHMEAHQRVGKSEVAALCDINPARLNAVRQRFGVSRAFHSAQELCALKDIDAVSIHTGDPFHAEPFVAAVQNGKHVLCEKPLANGPEQVEVALHPASAPVISGCSRRHDRA